MHTYCSRAGGNGFMNFWFSVVQREIKNEANALHLCLSGETILWMIVMINDWIISFKHSLRSENRTACLLFQCIIIYLEFNLKIIFKYKKLKKKRYYSLLLLLFSLINITPECFMYVIHEMLKLLYFFIFIWNWFILNIVFLFIIFNLIGI